MEKSFVEFESISSAGALIALPANYVLRAASSTVIAS